MKANKNVVKAAKAVPDIDEVFRSYFVTIWLLFGLYLVYAAFTFSPDRFSAHNILADLPNFLLALVFFPLLVVAVGGFFAIGSFMAGDGWACVGSLAVPIVFYLVWWGVWRLLYGRQQTPTA